MKALMKTSLTSALALVTGQAFALGLGPIQVRSGLNQPLVAEIPIIADSPAELTGLRADLASGEDFQRIGLNRARVGLPIDFAVSSNGRGQTVIKLTTKDIVREPFLDFLIEVNWSKGKLLREYTVLLDPPVTAPAVISTSKPAAAAAIATTQALAEPRPAAKPRPIEAHPATPTNDTAARVTSARTSPRVSGGEYGPVERGQTLSSVARSLDIGDGSNLNQVMLALLKANPSAFYRDNINALKSGAVLRVPSAEEIKAAGSLRDAAAAVQAQHQSWTENSRPTQVTNASTSAPASSNADAPASQASTRSDRVALVPPSAAKSGATGDQGGTGTGTGKDGAEARAELARTKETLVIQEQEGTELKSRVKQLEDMNDKGQHLISLKDSEIADLQNKLKELQAAKSAAAAAAVVASAAKPSDASGTKSVDTSTASPIDAPQPAPLTDAKSTAPSATTVQSSVPGSPSAPVTTPPALTTGPSPADAVVKPANAEAVQPTATPTSPPAAATPAPAIAPSDASTAAASPTATATSAPTPIKPAVTPVAKSAPTSIGKAWYADYVGDNPYLLYGFGAILLLLGGWLMTRFFNKPKPAVRPQYANDLPMAGAETDPADEISDEEHEQLLLDRHAQNPDDLAVSMELLRHYYVHGDAAHFEALADTLHGQLHEESPEWHEVLAMGEAISPHYALFELPENEHREDAASDFSFDADGVPLHENSLRDGERGDAFSQDTQVIHADALHEAALHADPLHSDLQTQRFEFNDLQSHADGLSRVTGEDIPGGETASHFDFDRVDAPAVSRANDDSVVTHEIPADDFLVDEDTISTRLDLARAYLDMGDPDGARSMLAEVLVEGNEAQKDEARKLLAELH